MNCIFKSQSHCIIRLVGEEAKLQARFTLHYFFIFYGQLTRQQLKISG